jgi:hypothetical protein
MSVESVVDTYLAMAQQLLGAPGAAPPGTAPPLTPAGLPQPQWTGNAAESALAASAAMGHARSRLTTAGADVSQIATAAAQISRETSQQLQGIITAWDTTKTALAATPQPLRDSALIAAGQQHIAEAVTLISATSQRYAAAAADVRATAADLPRGTSSDSPGYIDDQAADPDAHRHGDGPAPGCAACNPATAPAGSSASELPPTDPSALAPDMLSAAPMMMPAGPAGVGAALPSAMMAPMQSAAPAMAAPLGAMSQAAGPLSSLSGLANASLSSPGSSRSTAQPRPTTVTAAINAALDALGITDPAARERWRAGYETLIARESAGRPDAVNKVDTNARGPIQSDGAPAGSSRGLTQIIPENFQRYRVAGLSADIYDPVSNIAASMRYVMDRYNIDASGMNLAASVQQANPRAPARGY